MTSPQAGGAGGGRRAARRGPDLPERAAATIGFSAARPAAASATEERQRARTARLDVDFAQRRRGAAHLLAYGS